MENPTTLGLVVGLWVVTLLQLYAMYQNSSETPSSSFPASFLQFIGEFLRVLINPFLFAYLTWSGIANIWLGLLAIALSLLFSFWQKKVWGDLLLIRKNLVETLKEQKNIAIRCADGKILIGRALYGKHAAPDGEQGVFIEVYDAETDAIHVASGQKILLDLAVDYEMCAKHQDKTTRAATIALPIVGLLLPFYLVYVSIVSTIALF